MPTYANGSRPAPPWFLVLGLFIFLAMLLAAVWVLCALKEQFFHVPDDVPPWAKCALWLLHLALLSLILHEAWKLALLLISRAWELFLRIFDDSPNTSESDDSPTRSDPGGSPAAQSQYKNHRRPTRPWWWNERERRERRNWYRRVTRAH